MGDKTNLATMIGKIVKCVEPNVSGFFKFKHNYEIHDVDQKFYYFNFGGQIIKAPHFYFIDIHAGE